MKRKRFMKSTFLEVISYTNETTFSGISIISMLEFNRIHYLWLQKLGNDVTARDIHSKCLKNSFLV